MIMQGTLYIESLLLEASIGVNEEEKTIKQPLSLDLWMTLDCTEAIAHDQIDMTINYEEIARLCQTVVNRRHYHLIENLGAHLLIACEEAFAPLGIKIRLKKKSALAQAAFAAIIMQKGIHE